MVADTANLLEDAADRISEIARQIYRILLRRAALRLRNGASLSLADNIEEVLSDLAGEFGVTRNDMIRYIIREWMEQNMYLSVHMLDEECEVEGTA